MRSFRPPNLISFVLALVPLVGYAAGPHYAEALRNLQQKHEGGLDLNHARIVRTVGGRGSRQFVGADPSEFLQLDAGTEGDVARVVSRNDWAARVAMGEGGVMRFDIQTDVPTLDGLDQEGVGLYAAYLERALEGHPETQSIPAVMPIGVSDNARKVFREAFGRESSWLFLRLRLRAPKEERAELRRRIVKSLLATPAIKARAKNGFRDIRWVEIDSRLMPEESLLRFDVHRGETAVPGEFPVYLWPSSGERLALLPDGEVRIASEEDTSLKDFPDRSNWLEFLRNSIPRIRFP